MAQQPRFKATYRGETLGWYDTLAEAQAAIEAARQAETDEAANVQRWLDNN